MSILFSNVLAYNLRSSLKQIIIWALIN